MSRKKNAAVRLSSQGQAEIPEPSIHYLTAILAVGFLIRLFFLFQSKSDVLSSHLIIDAQFYDQWAQRIAQGDWWGKTVFYQDPLYAYFLALIYKIFGRDLTIVRVIQAVIDTATAALLYRLGRRLFDPWTGVLSAAMAALLSPLVYYVGLLDKTTLSLFLISAALALLVEAVSSAGLGLYAAAGAAFGLASLARGNMIVVAAAAAPWLLLDRRTGDAFLLRLKKSACFGFAAACVVGTVALRNYLVGRDLVLITANPGLNFFIGNNPYTIGQYIEPPFIRGVPENEYEDAKSAAERFSGKSLSKPSEVSRYWMGQGALFIVHEPKRWLALSAKKLFLAFHDFEIAETYGYDYFRDKYWSLALPFLTFGIIAPLGILGALRSLLRGRANALHVFLAVYVLTLVAFFVTSRYRAPLVIALVPFAAWFLVNLRSSTPTLKSSLAISAALAVLVYATRRRPPWFIERVLEPSLATAPMVAGHIDIGLGDFKSSIRELRAAIKANPRAGINYAYLGDAHRGLGDMRAARGDYEQAVRLDPQLDEAWENLGVASLELKEYRQAVVALQNALKLRPDEPTYRRNLELAAKLLSK